MWRSGADFVEASDTQAGTVGAPTPETVWSVQPVDTDKAPWEIYLGGASFEGTWDSVLYYGYNASGADATEPYARFAIEQDYENPADTHRIEMYWEMALAGGGTSVRPVFANFNRSTGEASVSLVSQGASSYVSIEPNEAQTVKFNPTSTAVAGNVPFTWTTAGAKMLLKAVNDAGSRQNEIMQLVTGDILQIGDANAGGIAEMRFRTVTSTGTLKLQSGTTTRFEANGTGIAFFGGTPTAKPTGVAVTAEGIHAALVSLGLIAA